MGRRKPLELQKGHLTKKEIEERKLEEQSIFVGKEQLQNVPDWLIDETAKSEWKRLVKEFSGNSLINNLDYNNLGAYCNAFSRYTLITKRLGTKIIGGELANKLITLELKYSDEMKKYASLLGLTAEGKLKALNAGGEKNKKDLEDEFGEI